MATHRVFTASLVLAAAAVGVVLGVWLLPFIGQARVATSKDSSGVICTLSRNEVLSESKVGTMANGRLQQVSQNAMGQIEEERQALVKQIGELNNESEALSQEELESRQKELNQVRQQLQQDSNRVNARIRYTRSVVRQRIEQEFDPLVSDRYQAQNCNVLLDRSSVLRGDDAHDLTSGVIEALNENVDKINFGLLSLPEQSSGNNSNDNNTK